jgi:hypothetical protein
MKVSAIVLIASVAANAALLAALTVEPQPSIPSATSAAGGSSRDAAKTDASMPAAATSRSAPTQDLWSVLNPSDTQALVARLRQAGFPNSVIRYVLAAQLRERYRPRLTEIVAKLQDTPYWQPRQTIGSSMLRAYGEYNAVNRELWKQVQDIVGNDPGERSGETRRFGDLPKAKVDAVKRIEDDYADMISEVRQAMQGMTLPQDREKLALLEREKRADLAGILSADELNDYEMRTSRVTSRLRPALTLMDASEAEFRAIYAVTDASKDQIEPGGGMRTPQEIEARRQAIADMNQKIRAAIGDARFADYLRASSSDYQQMYRLARAQEVPVEAVNRAYDMRNSIATEASQVANDTSRPREERISALKLLGQNAQRRVEAELGPVAAAAYVKNAAWLRALSSGSAFTVTAEGNTERMPVARAANAKR